MNKILPLLGQRPVLVIGGFALTIAAVLAFSFWSAQAQAHGYRFGSIAIAHPYAAPTPPSAKNGAVYFKRIRNSADIDDAIVSASSPVAERVELHDMKMDGDVMRMREVSEMPLKSKVAVEMKPGGGLHIMLINLKAGLKDGDKVPLKVKFKNAGDAEIVVMVEKPANDSDHSNHKH